MQSRIEAGDGNIYLVDFSQKYMEELLAKYDIGRRLAGVLCDTLDRMSGSVAKGSRSVVFREIELLVYPYQYICELGEQSILIILNDYFQETFQKLEKWRHDFKGCIYFFADRETEIDLSYREKYRDRLLKDIIIFRSGPHASSYVKGMDYADNARALFEHMLREGYHHKYEMVWLVKEPAEFVHIVQKYDNVRFLSYDWAVSDEEAERDAYYHALCLAKYIFMTDAYGFCRNARKDQVRVQLWHGCGFKTRVNFVRCERRYEYHIVVSEVYKKIHQKIYGLRKEQVIVTGYPKNDWLFHPKKEAWQELGLPKAKKYIFWLPTFRMARTGMNELNEYDMEGQTGLPVADTCEKLQKLDLLLQKLDAVLILKLHPFQDRDKIIRFSMSRIVLLKHETLVNMDIQINQILGRSDGMISDYSSVAVDYTLLDKPMGFTLDDVEEYEDSRGFVFENIREWLPGEEIFSLEDMERFIENVALGVDSASEKRRMLMEKMHKFSDDESCARVVDALSL